MTMIGLLACAIALVPGPKVEPTTVTLNPVENVWVYPFAPDPSEDKYLRTWGGDGEAVGVPSTTNHSFSYSCLKFDLKPVTADKTLKSAKLILFHVGEAGWSAEDAKKMPIEVRSIPTDFQEKNWEFAMSEKIVPPKDVKSIFGTASPMPGTSEDPFKVEIDLMKGPAIFKDYLSKALAADPKFLGLSLTTKLEPAGTGDATIYKFLSRHAAEKYRPRLELVFE